MKRYICLLLIAAMTAVLLLSSTTVSLAEESSHSLILGPDAPTGNTATKDRFTNILLLGVDYGFDGYWGSHHKQVLEQCHTDAFMVLSINMTTSKVNLISIPRDTVTYVPGVRGLYKLNAAFNCADTIEEGFKRACDAASWVLGGIKIDYYACVDMAAMIALGDHIGGVDLDVEMNYQSANRRYEKGMQHLDGRGMMDYARARKNATVNANDMGRTNRQRQVITAVIQKLRSQSSLVKSSWNFATGGTINFFTNMKFANVLNLLNKIKNPDDIGNHVIAGEIHNAANWNFSFTDQEKRKEVLSNVFEIEAENLPNVSLNYIQWLEQTGFNYVHAINLAKDIISFGEQAVNLSDSQCEAIIQLRMAYEKMIQCFDEASFHESNYETDSLRKAYDTLIKNGNIASDQIGYSNTKLRWGHESAWNQDPLINEYQLDWA